jgi:hypothetical protein
VLNKKDTRLLQVSGRNQLLNGLQTVNGVDGIERELQITREVRTGHHNMRLLRNGLVHFITSDDSNEII